MVNGNVSALRCALAIEPDFIVCDEAVSALDVSIQGQIVNLPGIAAGQPWLSYPFYRARSRGGPAHFVAYPWSCIWAATMEVADRDSLCQNPLHHLHEAAAMKLRRQFPNPANRENPARRALFAASCRVRLRRLPAASFIPRCPIARAESPNLDSCRFAKSAPAARSACIRSSWPDLSMVRFIANRLFLAIMTLDGVAIITFFHSARFARATSSRQNCAATVRRSQSM